MDFLQDMNQSTPTQELVAKDLHGYEWRFKHIFRGNNFCVLAMLCFVMPTWFIYILEKMRGSFSQIFRVKQIHVGSNPLKFHLSIIE